MDERVFVVTSPQTSFLLSGFAFLFNRYWPGPCRVGVAGGFLEGLPDNFYGLEGDWSRAILDALGDEQRLVVFRDVDWLFRSIRVSTFERMKWAFGDYPVGKAEFGERPMGEGSFDSDIGLYRLGLWSRIGMEPGLWDRGFFDVSTRELCSDSVHNRSIHQEVPMVVGERDPPIPVVAAFADGSFNPELHRVLSDDDASVLSRMGFKKFPVKPSRYQIGHPVSRFLASSLGKKPDKLMQYDIEWVEYYLTEVVKEGRYLEIGCGRTWISKFLLPGLPSDRVYACESSLGDVELLRREGVSNAFQADIFDIRAQWPGAFDLVSLLGWMNRAYDLGCPVDRLDTLSRMFCYAAAHLDSISREGTYLLTDQSKGDWLHEDVLVMMTTVLRAKGFGEVSKRERIPGRKRFSVWKREHAEPMTSVVLLDAVGVAFLDGLAHAALLEMKECCPGLRLTLIVSDEFGEIDLPWVELCRDPNTRLGGLWSNAYSGRWVTDETRWIQAWKGSAIPERTDWIGNDLDVFRSAFQGVSRFMFLSEYEVEM